MSATSGSEVAGEEQRAGWFELFFDLVFVVIVSVLATGLHGDPGPGAFGTFLVLFFPAWWAWVNLMLTVNMFGSAGARIQAMLVGAMPGLGLMAAAGPAGLGSRAWAYALGAAWVRLAYFLLWWGRVRSGAVAVPLWRPVVYGLVTAGLWAASAALPAPERFVLWGVAIALEVVLLVIRGEPERSLVHSLLSIEHMVERIGGFVVIVLGESVFTIVVSLTGHFTEASALAALLGFLVVAQLGAVFFVWGTAAAARGLSQAQLGGALEAIRDSVMYLPFLLVTGITALAAALGTAVAAPGHVLPTGACWGLCGGVLAFYSANAAISLRFGDQVRTVLGWYLPCLPLVLGVLLPAALLWPAWAAVAVAAGLVLGLTELVKLRRAKARRALVAP
ncbi:low temperature requirement protein A [Streptacidiphilus rugosus]|uniref:low temperature requirement protein A n=1 Tax=Streptacidiphilus rugosus TaxID=405783 RepID=UPI000568E384|nr:low temperature requirement protein A [Streptacidiphilus rugosus]